MAKKDTEITIEEKLRALYSLQLVDSRIDEIQNVRGELPIEVEDLEDEVAGLQTRLQNSKDNVSALNNSIKEKKNAIVETQKLSKRYTEQQKNVRNNREFDSLSKEIEFQDLEKQLAEKKIGEAKAKIIEGKQLIEEVDKKLSMRKSHLKHKKKELNNILEETRREEERLMSKSKELAELIDKRLILAYNKIRTNVNNGIAVASIDRGATEGSFFTIPPQRQLEIATRKKIIIDEHSGRILVDPALAEEEREKMKVLFSS